MLGVVFSNLFSNSLKSGGKDTEIEVTARGTPQGLLEIVASDTGPGIPDDMKTLVFDRFLEDSRKRGSYGLGLQIVKMLITCYGGTVWAEDQIASDQKSGVAIVYFADGMRADYSPKHCRFNSCFLVEIKTKYQQLT